MNNNQFRKLVFDTPARKDEGSTSARPGATPSAFGAKKSSFMPMTPRTVKGGIDVDFARQVRERNAALQPTKKFKSSAPRGVKYAAGYTDRAKAREEARESEDDKATRIQALEEQMKLGQISGEMFEALRDQITGGDIGATHLVKGLDRRLLERVRRGEDVMGTKDGSTGDAKSPDVDEELEKLGEKEVEAVKSERVEKRGEMAPPPPVAGVKRSRNEIMAELKAQRQAAAEAKQGSMSLDARWRKVGEKEKSRIEIDHKGREVLITVDEDGVVKKKVRKVASAPGPAETGSANMPDASWPVLGADTDVPVQASVPSAPAMDEDDDIFEGVGTEYNPLGDEVNEEQDSDEADDELPAEKTVARSERNEPSSEPKDEHDATLEAGEVEEHTATPAATESLDRAIKTVPRNYFSEPKANTDETKPEDRYAGIQSVLAKAARLDPLRSSANDDETGESEEAREARLKKRAQMLAQEDRDLDDMDMGFGSSRFEDEAEGGEEGKKTKLSEWKGMVGSDDEGWEEDGGKSGGKKKRKPKKRKGDANNAADIMRVIEGRKSGK